MKAFDTAACFSPMKRGCIKHLFYILPANILHLKGQYIPSAGKLSRSIFIMTSLRFFNLEQATFLANVALCLDLLCEK